MLTASVLVLGFACMYLSARLAERRGRSARAWMWVGAIFGPLALLALVAMPARRPAVTA